MTGVTPNEFDTIINLVTPFWNAVDQTRLSVEEFALQVRIAYQSGASGSLVGRTVWQEAMALRDGSER